MGRRKVKSLIINTASATEVAISYDGQTQSLSSNASSAESLTNLLENLSFDYRKVDNIYFISGPGSYTGLRVGLAYAQGIALSIGKPLTLVSSMLALCLGLDNLELEAKPRVSLALRASKKDYYSCEFLIEKTKEGGLLCLPVTEVSVLDDSDELGVDFTFEEVELTSAGYEKIFALLPRYLELKDVSFYNHYGSDEILYVKPVAAKSLKERNIEIAEQ